MTRVSKERQANSKKLTENRSKRPDEITLTEDELFYLDHHMDVLTKPTLAERLNLTINQLQYIIKKRKEARRYEQQMVSA